MAESRKVSLPLTVGMFAAFFTANGLIRAPFSSGSLTPFFIALAAGLILLPASAAIFRQVKIKGTARKAALFILAAAVFCAAGFAFGEYCDFIYAEVLTRADMWLIKAVFALCVFYLSVSDDAAVYKFGFLAFILTAVVFSGLFIFSAKTFEPKNLKGVFDLPSGTFADIGKSGLNLILPSFAAVVFLRLSDKDVSARRVLWGTVPSAVFCLTVVFDSVLSFGLPLAAKLGYPYIDDISTVTAGSLFTRMDGFAYFTFFACYLLKCAVCIKTSARLLDRAGIKFQKTLTAVLAAAVTLF